MKYHLLRETWLYLVRVHHSSTLCLRSTSPTILDDQLYRLAVVQLKIRKYRCIPGWGYGPLLHGLSTYVKDTKHILQIFDSFRFDPINDKQCFIFTMDIKSLYTVIPNDCGLRALAHFLDKRLVLQPATSTLIRLAELVLTLNTFSFNRAFFRQSR